MNVRALRAAALVQGPPIALSLAAAASLAATLAGRPRGPVRLLPAAGALAPAAYALAVRPWHLRWGAAGDEARRSLPGDALVPGPAWQATRAIAIQAPPDRVWPWLAQMGQGRGGFYTYDRLENLAGLDIHSADRPVPEWQRIAVGDLVRAAPEAVGREAGWRVAAVEPARALVLVIAGAWTFSWAFVLEPAAAGSTRLLVRSRFGGRPRLLAWLAFTLLVEVPHFVMERGMLLGIRRRVEALHQMERGRAHACPPQG